MRLSTSDLPSAAQEQVRRILSRSPTDWQPGKATPGVERGTWIVELVDDSDQVMGSVIVAEEGNQGEKAPVSNLHSCP
jgi:hypothetical protein